MKLAIAALLVGAATAFTPNQPRAVTSALSATRAVTSTKPAPAKKAAPVKAAPVKAAPVAKKAAPVVAKKAAPVVAKKAAPVKAAPVKAAPVKVSAAIKPKKAAFDPNFAFGLPGSLPPAGQFDPLGFTKGKDEATILRYRECEVMHGRFAQMAFLGFVVPEKAAQGANWGEDFLAPGGTALDALQSSPSLVYLTLALISGLEFVRLLETSPGARTDAKVESIGWRPSDPDRYAEMVVRELQNGRLAMLAVAGIVAQELINGKPVLVNLQENDFVSF